MRYFLAFDFFDRNINKFWSGIVEMDLTKDKMLELAREKVKEVLPYYGDADEVSIKITAFNNITVDKEGDE